MIPRTKFGLNVKKFLLFYLYDGTICFDFNYILTIRKSFQDLYLSIGPTFDEKVTFGASNYEEKISKSPAWIISILLYILPCFL